jgi:cell wall-active antibiotic response 4TMS protein YvqF
MGRVNGHKGRSHFVLGVILLCIGVVLLALNLGFDIPWHLWKYFPIPMIAFGLWGILSPGRDLDRIGGLWLLTNGVYCLIGVFQLFGLGWSTAWPIYIVTAGVAVLAKHDGAFVCRGMSKEKLLPPRAEQSGDQ